jgi:hypothetical protein
MPAASEESDPAGMFYLCLWVRFLLPPATLVLQARSYDSKDSRFGREKSGRAAEIVNRKKAAPGKGGFEWGC